MPWHLWLSTFTLPYLPIFGRGYCTKSLSHWYYTCLFLSQDGDPMRVGVPSVSPNLLFYRMPSLYVIALSSLHQAMRLPEVSFERLLTIEIELQEDGPETPYPLENWTSDRWW